MKIRNKTKYQAPIPKPKSRERGELGFVPVNNPNNVTLQIVPATLDEVDEL